MRSLFIAFACAALLAGADSARAEKRIFVVPADSDNPLINRCVTSRHECGEKVADIYCRAQKFSRALSYNNVDRRDITGGVPAGASACAGGKCKQFVAIECER